MHDVALVRGGQRIQNRQDGLYGAYRRQALLARQSVGQVLAVKQLGHHERLAVLGRAKVDDPADGWVCQLRCQAGFAERALGSAGRLWTMDGARELHGDRDVQYLIVRHPNHAHTALADRPDESIFFREQPPHGIGVGLIGQRIVVSHCVNARLFLTLQRPFRRTQCGK